MPEPREVGERHTPCVVGLTGVAGSGKSTVAAMLAALGAQTVDADALVRWAYNDPALKQALVRRFGPNILTPDGCVDRCALADIVFADTSARADLECLVHPAVLNQVVETIQAYRADPQRAPMLVVEIPLLFETGAEAMVDRVLTVVAPAEERRRRLCERGWTEARIEAVDERQMTEAEKAARADWVLETSGSLAETAERVEALWKRWVG